LTAGSTSDLVSLGKGTALAPEAQNSKHEQRAVEEHDVFVSYAREEQNFVRRLCDELEAAGLHPWVDVDGVYGGEEFWPEICKAIDAATALVYVISPHSAASPYCRREVDRAIAARKRVVPVCRTEVEAALLPPEVASRQWIFFRGDEEAETARDALVGAIRADWEWVRKHARLLVRAEEWKAADRDTALALRGRELREADDWLARPLADHAPAPIQLEYVRASHQARHGRMLRFSGMAAAALAVIALISWIAVNRQIEALMLGALDDIGKQDTDSALHLLAQADKLCSYVPPLDHRCDDVASNLGRALLDAGQYDDAIERLSRLLDATAGSSDSDAEPALRRAGAYRNRAFGRIMAAEAISDRARRDQAYALARQDVDAADQIEKKVLGSPNVNESALTTARILIGQGAYEAALKKIDTAAEFKGHEDTIALLRALTYRCLGREESVEALREYVRASDAAHNPQYALDMDYFERVANRCVNQRE
jgi:tetratricopeptide (TPR) repeat protein